MLPVAQALYLQRAHSRFIDRSSTATDFSCSTRNSQLATRYFSPVADRLRQRAIFSFSKNRVLVYNYTFFFKRQRMEQTEL